MLKTLKISLAVFIALLISWSGGYGVFLHHIHHLKPERPQARTDAIIVLTGGNHRIRTGLELWADGYSQELFITGVAEQVSRQKIFAHWKRENQRLPYCCMTLGYEATTTIENAIEAQKWIKNNDVQSIRLVTSTYHMPRGLLEFKNALPLLDIIPHPVEYTDHKINEYRYWKETMLEYHKIIWRFFQIHIIGMLV